MKTHWRNGWRIHCPIWLAVLGFALARLAPSVGAAAELPLPVLGDRYEFDGKDTHHLMGHVDINVPGFLRLRCDDLVGQIPEDAASATNAVIHTTGNVRIELTVRRGTNPPVELIATGGRGVYTGTNQLFVLTENAQIVTEKGTKGTLTGERFIYNLATGEARIDAPRGVFNVKGFTNLLNKVRKSPSDR